MADRFIIRDEKVRARALSAVLALDLSRPQEITIKPYRRSRTVEQNRLYWKILQVVADDIGCDAEALHDVARNKFLPPVFTEINGEVHEGRRSTTKLNVKEFTDYLERVMAWIQVDLGITIPMDEREAA